MLRIGFLWQQRALATIAFGLGSLPTRITGTVLLGILYAGTVNIMLHRLGFVLTPTGNPGSRIRRPVEARVAE